MKTEIKEIYKCDHCRKVYQIKKYAIAHENACKRNPVNKRPCFDCLHLEKKQTTHYYDTYCGEDEREISLLYCAMDQKFLYPPKVESKKNMIDLGDESNDPMPKQCNHYDIIQDIGEIFN